MIFICKWLETSSKNAKNHIMCIKLIQKEYSQLKLLFRINILAKPNEVYCRLIN